MATLPIVYCWRSNCSQMCCITSKASWQCPIFGVWMQHVYGHANQFLLEAEMSTSQQVNCCADKLAAAALITAVDASQFILSLFPSEKVCVTISEELVTGSPKAAITDLWREQVAQELYSRQGVVSKRNFPFVYWEGMEGVTRSFPEMFRVWVTKHVSHFWETNWQLSWICKTVRNVCPSCGCSDEAMSHITWCREPGMARVLTELVDHLVQYSGLVISKWTWK
jgi:hypothetical protein